MIITCENRTISRSIPTIHLMVICLTYLPLDKVAVVSQTTCLKCICMKNFLFRFKFSTEVCSRGSNWQPSIGLDNGLALNRRQAMIWTNADSIHWRIYKALGGGGGGVKSLELPRCDWDQAALGCNKLSPHRPHRELIGTVTYCSSYPAKIYLAILLNLNFFYNASFLYSADASPKPK